MGQNNSSLGALLFLSTLPTTISAIERRYLYRVLSTCLEGGVREVYQWLPGKKAGGNPVVGTTKIRRRKNMWGRLGPVGSK